MTSLFYLFLLITLLIFSAFPSMYSADLARLILVSGLIAEVLVVFLILHIKRGEILDANVNFDYILGALLSVVFLPDVLSEVKTSPLARAIVLVVSLLFLLVRRGNKKCE